MARPETLPETLIRPLTRLLRPLVRMLLRFNITYPVLCDLLKGIYVDVAEHDFPIDGKKQTDSRITLLTGVHRKDVRRLRNAGQAPRHSVKSATLGAQLVARWTGMPELLDREGRPRPLPRLGAGGDEPSFETLVGSTSKDIRPRAVLDEWLRLGIVHLDKDDRVWLNTDAFVPDSGLDEKAWFMGRNLHDHIAACEHNLSEAGAPMMERCVYYDALTPDAVAELESLARSAGMQALQAVNRRAIALQRASDGQPEATLRINFGAWFFHGPDDEHLALGEDNESDN
jgi:hypothetical protein